MTWSIFLACVYLGLRRGLGRSVVEKLAEEGGEIGITLEFGWPEIFLCLSDIL